MRVRLGGVTKSGGGKNTRAYVYTAYLEVTSDNAPVVTLHEPNGGLYEVSTLDFNFTVTDDVDDPIPTCTLYGNFSGTWEANESQSNVANDTKTSLTVSNLQDNSYVWNVQCTDSSSSAFAPANYSVTINANSPAIVGPALNESVINQSHKVMFNASITDSYGISHSYINLRYPNGTTKSHTLSTNGDEHYFEITDTYQVGYYNVTLIWTNDTYNQISQTLPETIALKLQLHHQLFLTYLLLCQEQNHRIQLLWLHGSRHLKKLSKTILSYLISIQISAVLIMFISIL
jgi:hypothetical protein